MGRASIKNSYLEGFIIDDKPKREKEVKEEKVNDLQRKRESIQNEIDRRLAELRAKKNSMIGIKVDQSKLTIQG